jgi:hypothetical protein
MSGDVHVRFCERLGRKFPGATRLLYLRAGSLNIFNGMIGLNFSCDGSHYLSYEGLLEEDSPIWQSVAKGKEIQPPIRK